MCHVYITRFEQPEKMKHTFEHNVGLSLLSKALCDLHNIHIAPEDLDANLDKNEYGKPFLKNHPEIHFNISHGSDIAICAVSDQTIGADIEKIHDFTPAIFRKVFTADEKVFWEQMAVSEDAGREWFFRFWTLKESRIKHAGMGLSMSLTDFSLTFNLNSEPYDILCSDPGVCFSQQILEEQYVLSLCTSTAPKNVTLTWL